MKKCDISKCRAACCYNPPLPKGYLTALKNRIVRPILSIQDAGDTPELGGKCVVAITDTNPLKNACPFLRTDCKCNIYDRRPVICRKFGTGEHRFLNCEFLTGKKSENIGSFEMGLLKLAQEFKIK